MTKTEQIVQALLFLAGEALPYTELARLLGISVQATKESVTTLAHSLGGQGLALVMTDTHAQLVTSEAVSASVQQYIQGETQELSAAAAETLAIIAYRGPMTRYDIEAIRGVDCRRMVRQLLARGLIRKLRSGQRFSTYTISEEFLQHLGLPRREDLPHFVELSTLAFGDTTPTGSETFPVT